MTIREMKAQALERGRSIPDISLAEEEARLEGVASILALLASRGYGERVAIDFLFLEQETEEAEYERPIDLLKAGRIEEAARMAERFGETGA